MLRVRLARGASHGELYCGFGCRSVRAFGLRNALTWGISPFNVVSLHFEKERGRRRQHHPRGRKATPHQRRMGPQHQPKQRRPRRGRVTAAALQERRGGKTAAPTKRRGRQHRAKVAASLLLWADVAFSLLSSSLWAVLLSLLALSGAAVHLLFLGGAASLWVVW